MKTQIPVMMDVELVSDLDLKVEPGKRSEYICKVVRDSLRSKKAMTAIEAAEQVIAEAKDEKPPVEKILMRCPQYYWKGSPKKPERGKNAFCDTHTCMQCINEQPLFAEDDEEVE
jgi:hypothetical protein